MTGDPRSSATPSHAATARPGARTDDRGPRVCVGLSVKNGERYLAAAVESVLAQHGVDFELRIMDNGSTDASVEIARGYESDPRVTVEVNDVDLNYYGSMNRALAGTDCDYFVPFADDDLMMPNNLAAKVEALESSGAGMVHSSSLHLDGEDRISDVSRDHRVTAPHCPPPWFLPELIPHNRVVLSSVLVRRSVMLQIGGFDARNVYAGDWQAWMRISLREAVVTLSEPLVAYRQHEASGTSRAVSTGRRGMFDTGTIREVLKDPAFPSQWRGWERDLIASVHSCTGEGIHREGATRLSNGWSGYWILARGLAGAPGDRQLARALVLALHESGLSQLEVPWKAVALMPETDEQARALLAVAAEMGPMLGHLLVLVHPDRREEAIARLEPLCADTPHDVAIAESVNPWGELLPGRIAVGEWQGEWIRAAEHARVPAWPMSAPDVFAEPPSEDHWQTLAPRTMALAAGAI